MKRQNGQGREVQGINKTVNHRIYWKRMKEATWLQDGKQRGKWAGGWLGREEPVICFLIITVLLIGANHHEHRDCTKYFTCINFI